MLFSVIWISSSRVSVLISKCRIRSVTKGCCVPSASITVAYYCCCRYVHRVVCRYLLLKNRRLGICWVKSFKILINFSMFGLRCLVVIIFSSRKHNTLESISAPIPSCLS